MPEPTSTRPSTTYVTQAKYDGGPWREWEVFDSYTEGAAHVAQLRIDYERGKFRLVARTVTDEITEA